MPETIPFLGTQMFCPDCHRMLVFVNRDGRLAIAGKTDVSGSAWEEIDEDGAQHPPDAFVVTQATCLRLQCVTKRWIRDKRRNLRRK